MKINLPKSKTIALPKGKVKIASDVYGWKIYAGARVVERGFIHEQDAIDYLLNVYGYEYN